jgi:hypothetical protein
MVIPFAMGTPSRRYFGGALFAQIHFVTLRSITNHFPSYLFPFIVDGTHIISPLQLCHLHMNTSELNSVG